MEDEEEENYFEKVEEGHGRMRETMDEDRFENSLRIMEGPTGSAQTKFNPMSIIERSSSLIFSLCS